jgi:serine protease Do
MIRMAKIQIALLVVLCGGALLAYAQETPPTPPAPVHPLMAESSKSSYLGVMVSDVTPERVSALKLKEERGCEVTVVDHDGPAFKAGLKEHDVILQFNDTKLEGVEELKRLTRETPPGRKVTLGIMRNGQSMNLDVTLGTRIEASVWQYRMPKMRVAPMPPMHIEAPNVFVVYGSRIGLGVENLTPQLGEYFGVKDGNGLLVRSVEPDSAAATAGFKAGDVILKAGDNKITDSGEWRNALHDYRGKKLPVVILRDKREQTITVDVPGRDTSENSFDFDIPDFDINVPDFDYEAVVANLANDMATVEVNVSEMTAAELQKHQVEIERAMRNAQRAAERERQRMQRNLERQQRELERQQREREKQLNDQTKP